MSRRIEGDELLRLHNIIEIARQTATESPCAKDHRGAVVFNKNGEILGAAFNGPLPPHECHKEICFEICGLFAMHAERVALIKTLAAGNDVTGTSILHVRVNEEGEIQISGDLRCTDCSGFMASFDKKQPLQEFILLQEDGWTAYPIAEANSISRQNRGLT